MALLILDNSNIALSPSPDGGFVLRLKEIEGLPNGLEIMVPFAPNVAEEVYDSMGASLGKTQKLQVADVHTMQREAARHGTSGRA